MKPMCSKIISFVQSDSTDSCQQLLKPHAAWRMSVCGEFHHLGVSILWVLFLVTAFPFSLHLLCILWHQLPKQNLAVFIDKSFKFTASTSACRNFQTIKNIYQIHENMHTKSKHKPQMSHLPYSDASVSKLASCASCLGWWGEKKQYLKIFLSISEATSPPSDASLTGSDTSDFSKRWFKKLQVISNGFGLGFLFVWIIF